MFFRKEFEYDIESKEIWKGCVLSSIQTAAFGVIKSNCSNENNKICFVIE
jgi:hypothetical protein